MAQEAIEVSGYTAQINRINFKDGLPVTWSGRVSGLTPEDATTRAKKFIISAVQASRRFRGTPYELYPCNFQVNIEPASEVDLLKESEKRPFPDLSRIGDIDEDSKIRMYGCLL